MAELGRCLAELGGAVAVALGSGGWTGIGCDRGGGDGIGPGWPQCGRCQSGARFDAVGLVVGTAWAAGPTDSTQSQSGVAGLDRHDVAGVEPLGAAVGSGCGCSFGPSLCITHLFGSRPDDGPDGPDDWVLATSDLATAHSRMIQHTSHRHRSHRFRWLALAVVSTSLLMGGCRRAAAPEGALQLWTLQLAPKFNTYMEQVIDRWDDEHPDAPVRWTDLPWGSVERKLLAAVFARTAPDVVNLNPPFAANLASKGGLTDLTPLLPPDAAQRYLPSVWRAARDPKAGQIAVPWYLTVRLSLVNQQLLQQAGVKEPPRRWEDVPDFARRIRERTGRYGLFVTAVPDDSAELLESMVQMGVVLLDEQQRAGFDSPEGRKAFAFWTDLYREGLLPREVVSQGQRRAIELYQSGELALLASGAEFLRSIQTNAPGVAAVTIPQPPLTGDDGTANVALMTLAVPRQSQRPQEALSFALDLTNGPNQARFAREARVLPSSLAALRQVRAELEAERPATPEQAQIREARLLSAKTLEGARVLVPATPGVKRLQSIVYTQLQRAMLGQISSEEAVRTAAEQWNRYSEARWP